MIKNISLKNKKILTSITFFLLLIAFAIQIGMRFNRLFTETIKVSQTDGIWNKRVYAIALDFPMQFEANFLELIDQIPQSIAFQTHFMGNTSYQSLLQYWYYPRKIGTDNRVHCYFSYDFDQKKIAVDQQLVYRDDKGNGISIEQNFYQTIIKSRNLATEWRFLLDRKW